MQYFEEKLLLKISFVIYTIEGVEKPLRTVECVSNETNVTVHIHRRRKYEGSSPNSLQPISYFGSIWELYVLDLTTNVLWRKKIQSPFPMIKGLTVPK